MSKNIAIVVLVATCIAFFCIIVSNSLESNKVYDDYQKYRIAKQEVIKGLLDRVASLDIEVGMQEQIIAAKGSEIAELQEILTNYKGKIKHTSTLLDSTREELLDQNALKDQAISACFEVNASLVQQSARWEGLVVTLKQEVVVLKKLNFEQNELFLATYNAVEELNAQNTKLRKQNAVLKVGVVAFVLYVAIKIIGG